MRSRALRKIAYRLLCSQLCSVRCGPAAAVTLQPAWQRLQVAPGRPHFGINEARGRRIGENLKESGRAITIPRRDDPFAGFEFVASPPAGVAMIVAILSDRPVHLVDLPDIAPPQSGQASFDQLFEVARQLRIAREDQPGTLQEPKWSFDAKLYVVR